MTECIVAEMLMLFNDSGRSMLEIKDRDTGNVLTLELCNNSYWKGRLGTEGVWVRKTEQRNKYHDVRIGSVFIKA